MKIEEHSFIVSLRSFPSRARKQKEWLIIVLSLITRINACNNKDFYQTIELTMMLSVEALFTSLPTYQGIQIIHSEDGFCLQVVVIVYKMVPV